MADPIPSAEAVRLPARYRPRGWYLISRILGGVALAAVAALMITLQGASPFVLIMALIVLAGASGMGLSLLRNEIELRADGIEVRGLTGDKSLTRAEITGYRLRRSRNSPDVMVLESNQSDVKVRVVDLGGKDEAFRAWFAALPDLDVQEIARAREEALADPTLGATPEDRKLTLQRWGQAAMVLNGAAVLLALWGFFAPNSAVLVALCLVPLAGVGLPALSRGRWTVADGRKQARASLVGLLLAPAAALALPVFFHMHVIDWQSALGTAAVAAGLALAMAVAAQQDLLSGPNPRQLIGIGLALMAWAWGAAITLDRTFDSDPPAIYPAQVVDKHVSHGRSTSYYLTLSPWGPLGAGGVGSARDSDLDVGSDFYDAFAVGDTVCLRVHPGSFGWRWYEPAHCQGG